MEEVYNERNIKWKGTRGEIKEMRATETCEEPKLYTFIHWRRAIASDSEKPRKRGLTVCDRPCDRPKRMDNHVPRISMTDVTSCALLKIPYGMDLN